MNIGEVTSAVMALAENGRCEQEEAILAIGAWSTWVHHPSLREDLFDGSLKMERLDEILGMAGVEVPWA